MGYRLQLVAQSVGFTEDPNLQVNTSIVHKRHITESLLLVSFDAYYSGTLQSCVPV